MEREGVSVGEDRMIRITLQSDDARILECATAVPFSSE